MDGWRPLKGLCLDAGGHAEAACTAGEADRSDRERGLAQQRPAAGSMQDAAGAASNLPGQPLEHSACPH